MGLLGVAVAMQCEFEVIHVHGVARVHAIHQGPYLALDLGPGLEEWFAEGGRMPLTQHRSVGVIVDQGAVGSPSDEHRLA